MEFLLLTFVTSEFHFGPVRLYQREIDQVSSDFKLKLDMKTTPEAHTAFCWPISTALRQANCIMTGQEMGFDMRNALSLKQPSLHDHAAYGICLDLILCLKFVHLVLFYIRYISVLPFNSITQR